MNKEELILKIKTTERELVRSGELIRDLNGTLHSRITFLIVKNRSAPFNDQEIRKQIYEHFPVRFLVLDEREQTVGITLSVPLTESEIEAANRLFCSATGNIFHTALRS